MGYSGQMSNGGEHHHHDDTNYYVNDDYGTLVHHHDGPTVHNHYGAIYLNDFDEWDIDNHPLGVLIKYDNPCTVDDCPYAIHNRV